MSLKPFKLFAVGPGPNPWKPILLLAELGLPYDTEYVDFSKLHTPVFEKYNPNGRVPALIDPNNNDFVLYESGAILEYLVEKYDPHMRFHSKVGSDDYYLEKQFLHLQMSGQGPYFGQAMWFHKHHPEQLQSAKDRYLNEVKRFTAVFDKILEGREYLVGNKYSYADMAFFPWYFGLTNEKIIGEVLATLLPEFKEKHKNFTAWFERLKARKVVKEVFDERERQIQELFSKV